MRQGLVVLLVLVPVLTAAIVVMAVYMNHWHRQRQQAIADEMQRLLEVYVTEQRWDPRDTAVSRQAEKTLKSKLIIN